MAKKGYLFKVASEQGKTVQALVIEAVEKRGSIFGAAKELGVTQATIEYHLGKAGLKLVTRLEGKSA